jgi:hypothetical protein
MGWESTRRQPLPMASSLTTVSPSLPWLTATRPGTLFIGTPPVPSLCVLIPSSANLVYLTPGTVQHSPVSSSPLPSRIRVHGVTAAVLAPWRIWSIPSSGAVISAFGPAAASVLRTLAPATPEARPAPGLLDGTETLVALTSAPVTGHVTVTPPGPRSGETTWVMAWDGRFTAELAPGKYRLTGHAGGAPCTPVSAAVVSGRVRRAPPLRCLGQ